MEMNNSFLGYGLNFSVNGMVLICLDLKYFLCNVAYDIKTKLNYIVEELNIIEICKNTEFAINVLISNEGASFKGIQWC